MIHIFTSFLVTVSKTHAESFLKYAFLNLKKAVAELMLAQLENMPHTSISLF